MLQAVRWDRAAVTLVYRRPSQAFAVAGGRAVAPEGGHAQIEAED
jgi:hypothetical protein